MRNMSPWKTLALVDIILIGEMKRGRVAQLGEHSVRIRRVRGSSPLTSTNHLP